MAGEETTYSVTALTVEDAELVTSLAELLEEQWPGKEKPGQESAIKRREKRLREQPKQGKQSFAFLSSSSKGSAVVGHFCLQKAVAAGGEPSCAVSSVVVRKSERGKGLGLRLMALAKEEALERGYRVMYLWTEDAKEFYRKSGFELCEKVNLFNAAVGEYIYIFI